MGWLDRFESWKRGDKGIVHVSGLLLPNKQAYHEDSIISRSDFIVFSGRANFEDVSRIVEIESNGNREMIERFLKLGARRAPLGWVVTDDASFTSPIKLREFKEQVSRGEIDRHLLFENIDQAKSNGFKELDILFLSIR